MQPTRLMTTHSETACIILPFFGEGSRVGNLEIRNAPNRPQYSAKFPLKFDSANPLWTPMPEGNRICPCLVLNAKPACHVDPEPETLVVEPRAVNKTINPKPYHLLVKPYTPPRPARQENNTTLKTSNPRLNQTHDYNKEEP